MSSFTYLCLWRLNAPRKQINMMSNAVSIRSILSKQPQKGSFENSCLHVMSLTVLFLVDHLGNTQKPFSIMPFSRLCGGPYANPHWLWVKPEYNVDRSPHTLIPVHNLQSPVIFTSQISKHAQVTQKKNKQKKKQSQTPTKEL